MNIGIVAPCNPYEFRDYFTQTDIPSMNENTTSVHALVNSFLDAGHNVVVFTRNENNKREYFISERLKIFTVPYRFVPRTSILEVYIIKKLIEVIREHLETIDLLHAHWTYEYAVASLKFAESKPVFCTIRDWCPYILSLPRPLLGKIGWGLKYLMFRKVMASKQVHFIANSYYTYTCFANRYPNREIEVIPNSIKRDFIKKEGFPVGNKISIVTIANGITDPRKNIKNLLVAFQKMREENKDIKLFIVGRYNSESPAFKQWKEMGLFDNINLTGQVSHDDIFDIIDNSTMMVHPALEETFGNVIIEAMARRIPVIGGEKSGAVPYVLNNGQCGILCDVNNPESIYDAMTSLLDSNNVKTIVNNATSFLLGNFSSEVVCKKHIELYSKYLNHN